MSDVYIHPTAFVSPLVDIGNNTVIGPNAVILGPCEIGSNCWIGPNAVIGTTAEDINSMIMPEKHNIENKNFWDVIQGEGIFIGSNTIVREHTTIHQGTIKNTYIGNNVFIMNKSHIGHDAYIDNNVRLSPSSMIGGHCFIFEKANIGMAAVVHQKLKIGAGAMIGMNSTVTKNINPYQMWYGTPAKNSGLNLKLLLDENISTCDINELENYYQGNRKIPNFIVKYIKQMEEN